MLPWHERAWAALTLLLCQSVSTADSKCCEKKVVPGVSSKAGTYNLVSNSDPVPDFCLGGCVYTKEDDPQLGTNYCFQEGGGNTTCSGKGCGGAGGELEGWIEKYFEKQCSNQINSVLVVNVRKRYSSGQSCGPTNYDLRNVSVELYSNPTCEGAPVQEGMTEGSSNYPAASFFVKVHSLSFWSIFLSKEGFKNTCQDFGMIIPFTRHYWYGYLEQEKTDSDIIPTVSLNFTFDINNELLSDVFVQGNPSSCRNSTFFPFRSTAKSLNNINGKFRPKRRTQKHKKKIKFNTDYDFFMKNPTKHKKRSHGSGSGSGSGGGSNYKCNPTCRYVSWNTDPSLTPCNCKGVIGGGLNFSDITLPDQQIPMGKSMMTGSLYWYNDTSIPYGYYQPKIYLAFAEFTRRNNTSVRVCDSKLSISMESKFMKQVPCFDPQIPPTKPIPTYPTYPSFPGVSGFPPTTTTEMSPTNDVFSPLPETDSPPGYGSGFGSGSSLPWPTSYPQWLTTTNYEDMFNEVDGVLIYGNGDRFWIIGCMPEDSVDRYVTLEVDFFTIKDPRETPEFCGCLLSTMVMGSTAEATKEQVKDCYVKAIAGGPSQRTSATWPSTGMSKRKQKKLQKHHEKKWKNKEKNVHRRMKKLERLNTKNNNGNALQHLKTFVKKMKAKKSSHFPRRSKRDATDEDKYEEEFDEAKIEEDFSEDMFEEEGDQMVVDFQNELEFGEYEYFDESEEDVEEDDYFDEYSLSSDW